MHKALLLCQDNSAHCWMFNEKHLEEIPLHTDGPELKESVDVKHILNNPLS